MRSSIRLRDAIALTAFIFPLSAAGCGYFSGDRPGSFAEFQNTQAEVTSALEKINAHISQKPYIILGSTNVVDMREVESANIDDGVELLLKLHKVSEANLSGTEITDEQIRRLGQIKTFFLLDFSKTEMTDEALNEFASHTVLSKLNASGTNVTVEGIAAMQKRRKAEMPRYPPIEVIVN